MSMIKPCLWFDGAAEEAALFYVALFGGAITAVSRYGDGAPFPAGTALMVEFQIVGQPMQALNGGPQFQFNEAMSLSIACQEGAEQDRYWDGLLSQGGQPGRCGWLKDRWGVSWQVVPEGLATLMADPDKARVGRAARAMMGMGKLDLAAMRAAAEG